MQKSFFEVFPKFEKNTEYGVMLKDVRVLKVCATKKRDKIYVYICSGRLIAKVKIKELEREMERTLFPRGDVSVCIGERFLLGEEYTIERLIDEYGESIKEEIGGISTLEYRLLERGRISCAGGDVVTISLEDSVIARERAGSIKDRISAILTERFGLGVSVRLNFREPDTEYKAAEWSRMDLEGKLPGEYREMRESGADTCGRAGQAAALSANRKKDEKKDTGNGKRWKSEGDIIFGRNFKGDATPICDIQDEIGSVVIRGEVCAVDHRKIRGEKSMLCFSLTDRRDSITAKLFCANDECDRLLLEIAKGACLELKGVAAVDSYDGEVIIRSPSGIRKIPPFLSERADNSPVKRVELHTHTKMSEMDGVSDVGDIIKCAKKWGHSAIAITDHGSVQAFPNAYHAAGDDPDFKVIYGMEAYLVDDLYGAVKDPEGQSIRGSFVVFDLETTGLSPRRDKIIEIGAVRIDEGNIKERFSAFVNPQISLLADIVKLTGINEGMIADAPPIEEVLPDFMRFAEGASLVAHNADFDMSFLRKNCGDMGIQCEKTVVDTLALSRELLTLTSRFKLDTVARALGVPLSRHHRALDDAECTAQIFIKLAEMLKKRGVESLDALAGSEFVSENAIRKMPTYHAILLAKNDTGRLNLYKLVSESHIRYFYRRPRIPKSLLAKCREGLIVGSACESGELYQAILRDALDDEVEAIAGQYDYLEIQPVGNNAHLLREEKGGAESEDDLREINKKIVKIGERLGKPVAATSDVHFLHPEDEIYRRIIMAGKDFKDADMQPPLYLRTTEEMLTEFAYLGEDKAREVVIDNTVKIANMCERISPLRPDRCPPVIENSDQQLRKVCYGKARELYGEQLPKEVKSRLERELNSIISNGFAVPYIAAMELVKKSNEDGYLVGSRGSVGSSLAATMAGITEVNPLPPHYLCTECHFSDFDSEEVRSYAALAGCDMPDRDCPVCGKKLKKDGFNIPFETFLGFKGNKEPDIDLNFSGDYQSRAHKYTEVMFGEGQTFRAGTIGALADKTAYGFVKGYFEDRGIHKRKCEINRLVQGCVGVRRTTGQHPGGIIVLPAGESIYSFTPIQHPANDNSTDIVTTHFDYHAISHNLLKLDILGHDDPTMIRMLQDLTGVDPAGIPLDSPDVMSLFKSTKALGIRPEDIGGCSLGSLGVPEFGTEFAMQMLAETKPESFSDLVRIAGLAHGESVWLGNAQTLIRSGTAGLSEAICTRDDIMTYLIEMGMSSETAFDIMEDVRKGRVSSGSSSKWSEWREEMAGCGVPEWYIESCEKIKYMFPKAHAAAYVMMAWRIAWFKIFHPLAYYAAFFSVRATAFSYEVMCMGREQLERQIKKYEGRREKLSKKEQDEIKDMRVVQEMYARGYEFVPINISIADPKRFLIIDGKLMPSLNTIEGMGDKAAEATAAAMRAGRPLSVDDFRVRTKVNKTVIELMSRLGLFEGLPESNQMSLFDML